MHIFPYSVRPGTKAAAMENQVEKSVRLARAREARALAKAMERRYLESCVGKTLSVLFEREKDGISTGHAGNYCQVSVEKNGPS
jgi:threonylcarbamoyladenosine tRNA methylthiotransferase MtaB